jgi:hypothetical protein
MSDSRPNKMLTEKEESGLIIKIRENEVVSILCTGLEEENEFLGNIKMVVNSELKRIAYSGGHIKRREWLELDISAQKLMGLFCRILRKDNELTKKLRKIIKTVMAENDIKESIKK